MADSYVLSREAEADLARIVRYTAEQYGHDQARYYYAQFHQSAQLISNYIFAGRLYITKSGEEFRQYNVGRHAIFYQPTENGVFIVRILHLQMDFDNKL